jgi:thymidylate kinase
MLVNIAGCDGSGKSTQIERLQPWIEREFGCPVRVMTKSGVLDADRFPEAHLFGCAYEELARDIVPRMAGESRSLFQLFLQAAAVCRYPPRRGEVVLVDGYWHKTYAAEAALGVDPAWLRQVGSCFPVPELSVLLDVDPRQVVPRGLRYKPYECGLAAECSDGAFVEHQRRMLSLLRAMAQSEGWAVIDAAGPAAAVCDRLQAVLRDPIARWVAAGAPAPAAAGAAEVAGELELLAAASGIRVPPELREGVAVGCRELRGMTALLRQPRTPEHEPAGTFNLREILRDG